MAVGFNLPDPYEAQKAEIARRQKYAQTLEQQAFQPVETYSYQGIQAPIPATAALAKVLAGLGAGYFEGQAAREQRELREGDIKKGQEFAAALQGAKTPEEKQALALRALGGELGQRAQGIAGPYFTMAETAQQKELARQAAAEKAREDREARAEQAAANRELRATIAAGQQQTAQILAGGRLEAQREGLQLRAEALERQRQEDARRAAQLSEAERRQVFQQQDQIDAGQSTLSLLAQASDLSGKFRGGAGAGTTAYLESQARSLVGMAPSEESNALINYDNLVKEQALGQLKSTFGGNPTEGERKVLLDLQASSGKTPEQRADILNRAVALAQERIKGAEQRRESILTRSYRQPGAAQAPAAPAAPTPPSGALTADEQRELDALRARFPRATR